MYLAPTFFHWHPVTQNRCQAQNLRLSCDCFFPPSLSPYFSIRQKWISQRTAEYDSGVQAYKVTHLLSVMISPVWHKRYVQLHSWPVCHVWHIDHEAVSDTAHEHPTCAYQLHNAASSMLADCLPQRGRRYYLLRSAACFKGYRLTKRDLWLVVTSHTQQPKGHIHTSSRAFAKFPKSDHQLRHFASHCADFREMYYCFFFKTKIRQPN
jgi:hypothetical protein